MQVVRVASWFNGVALWFRTAAYKRRAVGKSVGARGCISPIKNAQTQISTGVPRSNWNQWRRTKRRNGEKGDAVMLAMLGSRARYVLQPESEMDLRI